jgi:hypothetical protein
MSGISEMFGQRSLRIAKKQSILDIRIVMATPTKPTRHGVERNHPRRGDRPSLGGLLRFGRPSPHNEFAKSEANVPKSSASLRIFSLGIDYRRRRGRPRRIGQSRIADLDERCPPSLGTSAT